MCYNNNVAFLIPTLKGGGAERVCVSVANGLSGMGWNTSLLVLDLYNNAYADSLSKDVKLVDLKIKRMRCSVLALYNYIKSSNINTCIAFNYELTVILVIIKYIFRLNITVISRNISTLSLRYQNTPKNFKNYITRKLINSFYEKSDFIVNQCKLMEQDLLNVLPKLNGKTNVIYNPISDNIRSYTKNNNLANINKGSYILCVGRLEQVKSFDYVIKVFSRITRSYPDLRLKILGTGSLEHELKSLVHNLDILDRVDFEGFQQDLIPYYTSARATVLTSEYEGFPNVLLESISLGTPVVSFDCPSGPSEIIQDGVNGFLVAYKDINDLENKLKLCLDYKFSVDDMINSLSFSKYETVMCNWDNLLKKF